MDEWTIKLCWLVERYKSELAKRYWITMWLDVDLWWSTICWIHEIVLISKKFWFIQWLIENDKINRSKVLISFSMAEYDGLWNTYWHWVDDNQRLLMILTISDTPIKDLVSYLK